MDIINNPDHYPKGRRYQPLDVMEDWVLSKKYYLSYTFKYIAIYGRKEDGGTDLKKAIFYLEREIKRQEKANVVSLHVDRK